MYTFIRYNAESQRTWDEFVGRSRNATFLFLRGYMDYHADRFADCSLMAYKGEKLVALLPANITADSVLHSHQGLTYGGWILPRAHFNGADMMEMWGEWMEWCRAQGIKTIDYKPLPWIFATQPSQEDIYALWRHGARIDSVQISSTIDNGRNPGLYPQKRAQARKAATSGAVLMETNDVDGVMSLVAECLAARHDAKPVHTAAELTLLKDRFSDNIRCFGAYLDGRLEAAIVMYVTDRVAHSQYTGTTPMAREKKLLTWLHEWLINDIFADRRYFDFGTSNEDGGHYLNAGLLSNKTSLGATATAFTRYRLDL